MGIGMPEARSLFFSSPFFPFAVFVIPASLPAYSLYLFPRVQNPLHVVLVVPAYGQFFFGYFHVVR